jgi:hypothetical protein
MLEIYAGGTSVFNCKSRKEWIVVIKDLFSPVSLDNKNKLLKIWHKVLKKEEEIHVPFYSRYITFESA